MSRRRRQEPLGREKERELCSSPPRWRQGKQKRKKWVGCQDLTLAHVLSLHFSFTTAGTPAKQGCPAPSRQSISTTFAVSTVTCQLCPGPCLSSWRGTGGDKYSTRAEHRQEQLFNSLLRYCGKEKLPASKPWACCQGCPGEAGSQPSARHPEV